MQGVLGCPAEHPSNLAEPSVEHDIDDDSVVCVSFDLSVYAAYILSILGISRFADIIHWKSAPAYSTLSKFLSQGRYCIPG